MPEDIVADFVRLVRELDPERARSDLWRLERRIRDVWGGQRVYVCKAPAAGKAWSLAQCLAAGQSLTEARQSLGMSRRNCSRLANQRRRWVSSY